jgi:hypothetical protein
MISKKCEIYIMVIHYCILLLLFIIVYCFWNLAHVFQKNAEFILWLFMIVYCFWNLAHVFQKCGIYIMIIHYCILFWNLVHDFQKMRNLSYGYSWLYIVLEFSSCFPKNAVLWLFMIVYYFWNLVHDFQKCGIHLMVIHYCILFLEFIS